MKKLTSFNWVIKLLFMLGLMVAALFLAMPAEADDSSAVVPVTAPTVLTNQSVSQTNPTQVATSDATTGTTDSVTASSTASSTTTPSNSASSAAAPSEQSNDQGNQLSATKVNLQVTVNGQPLSDSTKVDQFTPFNIAFSFDFSGQDVKNGDYFNFTLPSILRVSNQQFPIVDQSTGTVLANVTVNSDDNTGRVVFNSVGSDAAGTFNIQMNVDTTKVPANKETPINISVNGENKIAGSFTYTPGTVSPDEMFSKYSYNDTLGPDKSNPNDTNPSYYTPDDITHGNLTYALRVNPGAKHGINGTTINDQLTTPGYRYDPDSFLVYRTTWTYTNGNWSNGALEYDSSIKPVIAADGRSFTLDFGDAVDGQGFVVFYRLLAYDANGKKWVPVNQLPVAEQPANGTIIGNNAVLKSTNNEPVYYNQTMQIHSSNGSGSISNFNIQGVKTWNDGNNAAGQRPTSITIDLYADDNPNPVRTVTTDASQNWEYVFTNLRRYREGETGAQIRYWVVEEPVAHYVTTYNGYNTVNTYVAPVNVTKVWRDDNNRNGARPTSITVDLYRNNVKTDQQLVLNNSNNWQGSLAGLPVYDVNGNKISYTWQEANVPTDYTASYDGQTNTITNTYTPKTTSVAVNKTWADGNNQDGLRPGSVTVELLANGQATGQTVTLDTTNNWTASFDNLAVNKDGQAIIYTVQEKAVSGYTSTVSGDAEHGFTITNTHIPATIDKAVNKVWVDGNNQDGLRPDSVTVELLADGQTTGQTVTLNTGNNWRGSLSGLAEYANGKKIVYTWQETDVPTGYTATVDGDTVTNTHTPATVDKSVNKVWVDGNNQDGLRPDAVTVELLADGQATGQTVTLNAGNNWRGGLSGLAEYANGKKINYTWQETDVPTGYTATVDGDTVTNTHTPATIDKTVNKVWVDGNNQDGLRPGSVTVELLADGQATGQTVTLNAGNNWRGGLSGLAEYANGKKITYTWQETDVPAGYTATVDGDTITNTHTPATIDKAVNKVWVDGNNQDGLRPGSVTVELLADGQATGQTVTLNAGNNWRGSLSGLAEYANGKKITYTWQETDVPAGYTATVDGDTITNTHTPATINKSVNKVWVDGNNQDGLRPGSVTVELLADGQATGQTVTLNAGNNWRGGLSGLAEYANGKKITYTWQEADVPAGYTATVDGDTITNTHTPATVEKSVNKVWVDGNNQDGLRPNSVTVELLADGQATGQTVTLNAGNNWRGSLSGLAEYANGKKITYTWREENVPAGYTATVDGDTVTNTHTPATVDKAVNKVWVDGNNQDGLRPDSVTVELLADGQATGQTVTLNAGNNWRGGLSGLAEYANGKKIVYTWREDNVPTGYTATVDGDTVTNTHTPATVDKSVNKVWVDGNNQDGLRPNSVTVELLADGQTTGQTVTLNAGNNWRGGLSGLAEYANGKKITYTWREENVPAGYTATVDGDTVTNTHTPATIDKSVNKVWVDGNNQDGLRPGSVTVELLADGQATGQTVTLNAGNNWRGGLSGLAEYANGKKITYTWQETDVPVGYTATVDGDTVTNTHTPATIDKSVNKVWVDGNNQDGLRPDSVTVELLADGQATGQTVTLNAGNNWRGGLSGLAEYANGKKIVYTWREDNVPASYTATVDGDTVTNTHTPATIDKAVNKVWVDGNNQDGLRPNSVTVELLADGQATGQTVTLNAGNNWRGSLSGLAEYANGKKITYTWREENVPTGYTATVDGDTVTNTHTPATITKTVMKQWVDGNNQDGLRPGSIMVNLLANGKIVKTVELSAQNDWTAFITNLAKFANGQLISYEWQEVNVPGGYQSVVNGDVITNTHVPAVTTLNVKKVWNDANNQDGLRPKSIMVQLLANGQAVATAQLDATNNWMTSFDDLAVNQDGQPILYTVKEVNIPSGYQSVVTNDGNDFVITNTHIPNIPNVPDTPEQPDTPDVPDVPDTPGQPDTPDVPNVPDTPEQPDTPDVPNVPDIPGQPDTPDIPSTPEQPNTPTIPGTPERPLQPQPEGMDKQLPQTGNCNSLAIVALGLLIGGITVSLATKHF